jgi:hypothetical protein
VKKAKEAICVCFYKGKAKRKVMVKVKSYREESEFFFKLPNLRHEDGKFFRFDRKTKQASFYFCLCT